MKFSIIVPAYNTAPYLPRCIESILAQNYPDWELIVVNDGSTDETGSTADRYASLDSRITALRIDHQGLGAARNTGIRHAAGEYLLFIDSDDYIVPGSLQAAAAYARGADLVILKSRKVFNEKPLDPPQENIQIHSLSTTAALENLVIARRFLCSACDKAVKRSFILNHQIFFPEHTLKESMPWNTLLLANLNTLDVCEHEYYCYVQHRPGSMSRHITGESIEDSVSSLESCVAVMRSCTEREKIIGMFLADQMIFILKYSTDFGTPKTRRRSSDLAFLLNYSIRREHTRYRLVTSILGFRVCCLYAKYASKWYFRKKKIGNSRRTFF